MKEFIRHLWRTNRKEIIEKSILNCHAVGVHSIMFVDKPGNTVRLYYTDMAHTLWKREDLRLSVGFHAHHCDLTLYCIKGKIENWIVKENLITPKGFLTEIKKYLYTSKILKGETNFQDKGITYIEEIGSKYLHIHQSIRLKAQDLHTIVVPRNLTSAWFVFEGHEDPFYVPYVYTNTDLLKEDFSNLYKKFTEEEIESILIKCELL